MIKCQCCPPIETSQLIYTANQLTGFYMRATLALNGLTFNLNLNLTSTQVPVKNLRLSFLRKIFSDYQSKTTLEKSSILFEKSSRCFTSFSLWHCDLNIWIITFVRFIYAINYRLCQTNLIQKTSQINRIILIW